MTELFTPAEFPQHTVVDHRTFKPGDRVVVCTPEEMGNRSLAWGNMPCGAAGTVIGWDSSWLCWDVAMDGDEGEPARWQTSYLKPEITTIEDVDKYLAS